MEIKGKQYNIFWLILPSVVFFLLVATFVVKLGPKSPISTEVIPSPTPTPISTSLFTPAPVAGLSSLVGQIQGWQVVDPKLAAPAFDRKISLPAE